MRSVSAAARRGVVAVERHALGRQLVARSVSQVADRLRVLERA